MPRPRRCRRVFFEPGARHFRPEGAIENGQVTLTIEEVEAIRLSDLEEKSQADAAEIMNISQPTFNRIIKEARKKSADAIANGRQIKIQGGDYYMPNKDGTGPLGKGPKTGRGMGICPGQVSDMLAPLRRGGGPYGKGRRFQLRQEEKGTEEK